jgi:hypothetical protein
MNVIEEWYRIMTLKKETFLFTLGCLASLPFTGTAAMAATAPQPNSLGEAPEPTTALLAEANTNPALTGTIPSLESALAPAAVELPTAPASDLQLSLTAPVLAQMPEVPPPVVAPQAVPQPMPTTEGIPVWPGVQPQAQPVMVPQNIQPSAQPNGGQQSKQARDLMNTTAQGSPAPERRPDLFMPPQLFNLDTANHLKAKDNTINVGFRWYFPTGALRNQGGRGQQVVYGGFSSGLTDKIQLDLGGFYIGDFLTEKINGLPIGTPAETPFAAFGGGFVQAKYQVIGGDRLRMSVAGSFEMLATASSFPLFTNDPFQNRRDFKWSPVGAIQLPISYKITRGLQAHFTPTLAILPEEIRGGEFYGTSFILGGGLSWQPVRLVGFFADVNYPVGPGGNTVRSEDGDIVRRPVWSGGVRFNMPEFNRVNISLDLYATNAMGTTPATRALSQLPNSDQVSFSSNLTFRF